MPSPERMRLLIAWVLPMMAVAGIAALIWVAARSAFALQKVVFSGNAHLSDEELRAISGLRGGENILLLSGRSVAGAMSQSPWIRSASVRKEFPDSVHLLIREAEPYALLDMKGRLFIVDDRGRMLEELRDTPIPFLPVISGNPFDSKEAYAEAINLAAVIRRMGLPAQKNRIEIIAHRMQDLAVNVDGLVIKVGPGEYEEKLGRLLDLEGEIKTRRIPVDYIDLRFANKVIVKPVNEVIR